jgi:alkylation response protein AidB-like acyl-CoA dehydrogenase
MPPQQTLAERGMAVGLKAINAFASSDLVDRVGLRKPAERILFNGSKQTMRVAGNAGRIFKATQKLGQPERQPKAKPSDLFDLTPTEEQQMLVESVKDFALDKVRKAAHDADAASQTPEALLQTANELGVPMIGVPEALGGVVESRSAVTAALMAEALAEGDMGIAVAALAPAGVATAISLWGDADQQAAYLPAFVGDTPPAAAVAVIEPQALFNPFALNTTATATADGYVLNGTKSLVVRAADNELFVVAAKTEDGPALFILEAKTPGVSVEAEPAMGLRAAATGKLVLSDVKLDKGALLGDGDLDVYKELIALGRIGWSAVATGTSQAVLDYVKQYVNDRVAFGEPISNRQAVAFKVADIAIELDSIRLLTYRAAALADAGNPEFIKEAALARSLTFKYGMQIGSDGVQLLGGHGYTKEHPVERWYRDLRAAGLIEGALVL